MKDMPAMGKRDFDISTTVTGDSGEQFLETLTADQRAAIEAIPTQESGAMKEIADLRRQISTELRKFLAGGTADREKVRALGRRYGELDGELSWRCAVAFAAANRTLTDAQRAALMKLRNLDGYQSAPAYIYSRPAREAPELPALDAFFGAPAAPSPAATTRKAESGFRLGSPAFADGEALPVQFTGDGEGISPPLAWSSVPEGTKSLAVVMHHEAPDRVKWYWVLYNLPAGTRSLPANAAGVGTLGNNSVNGRAAYAPPHSRGPGTKRYVITLYALSEPVRLDVPPAAVTRDILLDAMKGHILATAELTATYTRPDAATSTEPNPAR